MYTLYIVNFALFLQRPKFWISPLIGLYMLKTHFSDILYNMLDA